MTKTVDFKAKVAEIKEVSSTDKAMDYLLELASETGIEDELRDYMNEMEVYEGEDLFWTTKEYLNGSSEFGEIEMLVYTLEQFTNDSKLMDDWVEVDAYGDVSTISKDMVSDLLDFVIEQHS